MTATSPVIFFRSLPLSALAGLHVALPVLAADQRLPFAWCCLSVLLASWGAVWAFARARR